MLYRVAQEGLTKIARHAEAENVRLAVRRTPGAVVPSIADDGRGTGLASSRRRRPGRHVPGRRWRSRVRAGRDPHPARRRPCAGAACGSSSTVSPVCGVVADAGDGAEAIAMARSHTVELAVLDIAMPRTTGLQAARELATLQPGLRIPC